MNIRRIGAADIDTYARLRRYRAAVKQSENVVIMQMGKKYIDLGASREVRRRVVQSGTAVQHKRVFFRAQDVAAGRAAKPQELGTGHRVTYTIPIYSSRGLVLAPLTPSCVPFGRRRFNSNNKTA